MAEVAHIPFHHAKRRLDTLLPDEIIYTENKANEFDYDDHPALSYDSGTSELFVYRDSLFDPDASEPNTLMGRAAIMRVIVSGNNDSHSPLSGFVVDLRRLSVPIGPSPYRADTIPDDTEEQNYWRDSLALREPVLAVAALDHRDELDLNGDEKAFDALRELVETADALAKSFNESEQPTRKNMTEANPNEEVKKMSLIDRLREKISRK